MSRSATVWAGLLWLVAAVARGQERGTVAAMGACSTRAPRLWLVVDGATSTDCAAGSGTSQVLCLCSGGAWAALGTVLLPAHLAAYSPDRAPSSCATCDEFDGSFTQTWAWVNQGTSTDSSSLSAATIVVSGASAGVTARAIALPASDFTVTTKVRVGSQASAGLALLYSGTNASPTGFVELVTDWNGSNETLLKQIAGFTGGRFNPDPGEVFDTGGRSVPSTMRLWPALLALAVLLNVAELVARKWRGLVEHWRARGAAAAICAKHPVSVLSAIAKSHGSPVSRPQASMPTWQSVSV